MATKVSLVEDDAVIREELECLLQAEPDIQLINSYENAEQALAGLPSDRADVVLMDINLPGMSGDQCVRELNRGGYYPVVLMLTVYEDTDAIFRSLTAGASGYLLKRTAPRELVHAIRQAAAGSSPMSGHIARKVVQYFHHMPAAPRPTVEGLSPREHEVLDYLSKGLMYKEIGERLNISIDTVRKHIGKVYQKLHVHSRTEAVVKYLGR
jgi:DNA-binding NarL/FixJ family response regulator